MSGRHLHPLNPTFTAPAPPWNILQRNWNPAQTPRRNACRCTAPCHLTLVNGWSPLTTHLCIRQSRTTLFELTSRSSLRKQIRIKGIYPRLRDTYTAGKHTSNPQAAAPPPVPDFYSKFFAGLEAELSQGITTLQLATVHLPLLLDSIQGHRACMRLPRDALHSRSFSCYLHSYFCATAPFWQRHQELIRWLRTRACRSALNPSYLTRICILRPHGRRAETTPTERDQSISLRSVRAGSQDYAADGCAHTQSLDRGPRISLQFGTRDGDSVLAAWHGAGTRRGRAGTRTRHGPVCRTVASIGWHGAR